MRAEISRHAYYSALIADFLVASDDAVLGQLYRACGGTLLDTQRDAWLVEIALLRNSLHDIDGVLLLEFDVPRIGSRIDAVVISRGAVIVIEFKVGEETFRGADINQVWDYALDLKNFHQGSHAAPIVPILVATEAADGTQTLGPADPDLVFRPMLVGRERLDAAPRMAIASVDSPPIAAVQWGRSSYKPTPTIIEAARALYAHHSVDSIARNDAETQNLGLTSKRVEAVIEDAKANGTKAIVFDSSHDLRRTVPGGSAQTASSVRALLDSLAGNPRELLQLRCRMTCRVAPPRDAGARRMPDPAPRRKRE